VETFLAHFCAKHRRPLRRLSADAMNACQRFPWPGNVRQLRNAMERLVVTSPNSVVGEEELPDYMRSHDDSTPAFTIRPGMTLAEAEKQLIRQTLRHVTSHRGEAAKLLGISRRALQYKLKRYGLLEA
jgi:DNA-binding NtrC family response regulator